VDERRALMAAIIANPDEDTPRLVFADWLQANGDKHDQARAEFIRLQIEIAKLPEKDPRRKKLSRRAEKLVREHDATWIAPLLGIEDLLRTHVPDISNYARGLWGSLFAPVQHFLLNASQRLLPDAFAAVGVEEVLFAGSTKRIEALASAPALRWVARVIYPEADDKFLRAFGGAENCAHLSSIELENPQITDTGLRAFARTTGTRRLCRFALTMVPSWRTRRKYTATGILALLESDRFPLDALCLTSEQAKFDYAALLASPHLKRLTRLTLGTSVPVGAVAACPHLTGLRELAVEQSVVENADVDALLASPALKSLEKLTLWDMNAQKPRLSQASHKKLRDRFDTSLKFDYSVLVQT
jgi:uncharacterized protein (TIGR02996 family)